MRNRKIAAAAVLMTGLGFSIATSCPEPPYPEPPPTETGWETGWDECDDPLPAVCVSAVRDGHQVTPSLVEVRDAEGAWVQDIACAEWGDCCSYDLPSGRYGFLVRHEGEIMRHATEIENSFACDHEPTLLVFDFSAEEEEPCEDEHDE